MNKTSELINKLMMPEFFLYNRLTTFSEYIHNTNTI